MTKRIFKIVAGVLLAFLVILTGICIFLGSSHGENLIKSQLIALAESKIGRQVNIAALETNVLSRIQIQGISLIPQNQADSIAVFDISRIHIDYNLIALITGGRLVDNIMVDSIIVNLTRDSLGVFNLPITSFDKQSAIDDSSATKDFELDLGAASLKYFQLNYDDRTLDLNANIDGLKFTIKSDSAGGHDLALTCNYAGMNYDNFPLTLSDLTLDGRLSDNTLALDNLQANLMGLNLAVGGQVVLDGKQPLDLSLRLSGDPDALFASLGRKYDTGGISGGSNLDLNLAASGTLSDYEIEARFKLAEVNFPEASLRDLYADIRYADQILYLDTLMMTGFGGKLVGRGEITEDSLHESNLTLAFAGAEIAQIWSTAYDTLSPYQGKLDGYIILSGRGADIAKLKLNADFIARDALYLGKPLPDFFTKLQYDQGRAEFLIHQPDFNITGRVDIQDSAITGSFRADLDKIRPLAYLLNIPDITGSAYLSGSFNGKPEAMNFDCALDGYNIHYRNFPLDTLSARLRYNENILQIDNFVCRGKEEAIDSANPPFGIDSLSGGFDYYAEAAGTLGKIKGQMMLSLNSVAYRKFEIDSGELKLAFNNNKVVIDTLSLRRKAITVDGEGEFDYLAKDGSFDLDFIDAIRLSESGDTTISQPLSGNLAFAFSFDDSAAYQIRLLARKLELGMLTEFYSDTLSLDGLLDLDLDFEGTAVQPELYLVSSIRNGRYNNYQLDSLKIAASYLNNSASIHDLYLYYQNQSIEGSGVLSFATDSAGRPMLDDTNPTYGKLKANDFDLGVLNIMIGEGIELTGSSSADIVWNGTIAKPGLTGDIKVKDGRAILYTGAQPIDSINVSLKVNDYGLTIDSASGLIAATPMSLSGMIKRGDAEELNLDLDLNIAGIDAVSGRGEISNDKIDFTAGVNHLDLSLLQPFLRKYPELAGDLYAAINITGKPQSPQIKGELNIVKFATRPSFINEPISEGRLNITFDDSLIVLDSLFARVNKGSVVAYGNIAYDGGAISSTDLRFLVKELNFSLPKTYTASIKNAELTYSGSDEQFLLDGDIEFGESKLLVDFKPQSILPWVKSVETTESDLPELFEKTRLDIRIRESDKLWVDNNLAGIRMQSALQIVGSPIKPNFLGRVSVVEGYILYIDRKFKVKQGIIYFNDPRRFNPEIDIQTQASVTSYQGISSTVYTVYFNVSGTPENPLIELYSEPPLDKSDIISLLSLGATRKQLVGKDSEGRDVSTMDILKERAEMLSSQRITGYISQKVETLLGLDQVSVEGNLFRANKAGGPELLVSKKFAERMELTYKTTVGHSNDQSIRLNYELTKRISVEGQTDRQGRSSLDLIYGLRFE